MGIFKMTEIVCPHCHTAFKIDESGYAEILKQVHDKDFDKQLGERIKALEDTNKLTTELAVSNAKAALEKECDKLKAELEKMQMAQELALANAVVYLAIAAKSNAVYMAYNQVKAFVASQNVRHEPSASSSTIAIIIIIIIISCFILVAMRWCGSLGLQPAARRNLG
jgi:hypothetical protein